MPMDEAQAKILEDLRPFIFWASGLVPDDATPSLPIGLWVRFLALPIIADDPGWKYLRGQYQAGASQSVMECPGLYLKALWNALCDPAERVDLSGKE